MNSRSPSARSETKASAVRAPGSKRKGAMSTPCAGQRVGEEMAERVVAHLAHEGAGDTQAGEADGDVGGGTARRLLEGRRVGQAGAGDGRHEVDQQIADADDWAMPSSLGRCGATCRSGAARRPGGAGRAQRGADQPL